MAAYETEGTFFGLYVGDRVSSDDLPLGKWREHDKYAGPEDIFVSSSHDAANDPPDPQAFFQHTSQALREQGFHLVAAIQDGHLERVGSDVPKLKHEGRIEQYSLKMAGWPLRTLEALEATGNWNAKHTLRRLAH